MDVILDPDYPFPPSPRDPANQEQIPSDPESIAAKEEERRQGAIRRYNLPANADDEMIVDAVMEERRKRLAIECGLPLDTPWKEVLRAHAERLPDHGSSGV